MDGSNDQLPLKIQLALQGGGAKITALLATLEVVQQLQIARKIEITRFAGTSAGSIAGCLLAANINISNVRERLKKITHKELTRHFPRSRYNVVKKLALSKPLWNSKFFENQLKYFFDKEKLFTLEDLKNRIGVEPIIIATNLTELRAEVYSSTLNKDKRIIEAILDSCGLPYCFRVWNKGENPVIVDGGICENLPSEFLEEEESKYGQIIGISFEDKDIDKPNSFTGFTTALMNTAINHSIKRAKRRLGGRIFNISTKITTFDFHKAFSDESDDEYRAVKEAATKFFDHIILNATQKKGRIINPSIWDYESKEITEKLWKIYNSQHRKKNIKYNKARLEVQAGSLTNDSAFDYVSYELEFVTLSEPIYCMEYCLSEAQTDINIENFHIENAEFSVKDCSSGKYIDVIYVPAVNMNAVSEKKMVIINFVEPLPANSGPYVLECKDTVYGFVGGLKESTYDFLDLSFNRAFGNINKIDFILHTPNEFPNVLIDQKDGLGKKLTPKELKKYNTHPKFKKVGWTVKNVNSNFPIKVELYKGRDN